jgi:hypothetical protein
VWVLQVERGTNVLASSAPGRERSRIQEFTSRDGEALAWLGEMYGARFDVLAVLLGRLSGQTGGQPLSVSGVRKQVDRWKRAGLVKVERALSQSWVTLTAHGYARVGQTYGPWAVPVTRVRHVHAVNVVRLWYEGTTLAPEAPWVSERALFVERGKTGRWHIPDGVIVDPQVSTDGPPRHIAIEVELTHKGRRQYDEEVFGNLRAGVEQVNYFVPNEAFAVRLRNDIVAVLEKRRSTKRFSVQLLPEFPGVSYEGIGWS